MITEGRSLELGLGAQVENGRKGITGTQACVCAPVGVLGGEGGCESGRKQSIQGMPRVHSVQHDLSQLNKYLLVHAMCQAL